jgi:hypothetical protein
MGKGTEPTKEAMDSMWVIATEMQETDDYLNYEPPITPEIEASLVAQWEQHIAGLEGQLDKAKAHLIELKMTFGIYDGKLLHTDLFKYRQLQQGR